MLSIIPPPSGPSPRLACSLRWLCHAAGLLLALSTPTDLRAQSDPGTSRSPLDQLQNSVQKLTDGTFQLSYRYRPGETLRYEVIHQTAVETKVNGNSETVRSRSKSIKRWHFADVADDGTAQFSHSIESVKMWSEMSGRKPIRYDSETDAEPPVEYESIAETLGKPLSVVRADRFGEILHREDTIQQIDRGTGGMLVPLPAEPVKLQHTWSVPAAVQVQLKDGTYQTIKIRRQYRLESVQSGVATISLTTQVLTPVTDARVKSQLVQKLSRGEIKFDIDAGRMVSKTLDWDETVIGFNGPESSMSFLARMTEVFLPQTEMAVQPGQLK